MGVKVTFQRYDNNGEVVTRTFDNANEWFFVEEAGVRTLRLKGKSNASSIYISEFLADGIESVEFV